MVMEKTSKKRERVVVPADTMNDVYSITLQAPPLLSF